MKNTVTSFLAGAILMAALVFSVQVFAGVAGFKTDLKAAVGANFTAGEQQKVRDSFVSAYQAEWDQKVAAGTVDNAANRGDFAADKIIAYIQGIVFSSTYKASLQAVATPTPLP
jgi:hypothetical protein